MSIETMKGKIVKLADPIKNQTSASSDDAKAPQYPPTDRDPSSVQIARIAGIPVRLHFTFLLLLAWIGFGSVQGGVGWARAALVVGLFACVALHEFGHVLTAKRFGIQTSSVTLYPIGGIARNTEKPKPNQELWIALAGPAVNVIIAAALSAVVIVRGGPSIAASATRFDATQWLQTLLQVNVALALFNLIPAFPMDGGRILRAFLALRGLSIPRATQVAASIGQVLAIIFAVAALFWPGGVDWVFLFIAFFIYIGAGQEAQIVRQEAVFTGVALGQVMLTNVETLVTGNTLREVADRLLHTSQQDFPVLLGEQVVGLMTRDRLLQGLSAQGPDVYVAGVMARDFRTATPTEDLSDLLGESSRAGMPFGQSLPLLVMDNGRLRGMVTAENLAEYFAIQQILGRRKPQN